MSEDLGPVLEPLLKLMDKHDLLELEVAREGMKIRIKKKYEGARKEIVALGGQGLGAAPLASASASPAAATAAPSAPPGSVIIKSPMVGTFYRQSSPEAEPYVDTGDQVKPDTVVCLIEAMKVFNEIKAEVEGEIVEILVDSGQAVEYGQPLYIVKPL